MAAQQNMFDLPGIPVLKVLIPFTAGVLTGGLFISSLSPGGLAILSLLGWTCLLGMYLKSGRKPASLPWLFSLWAFLLFFVLGTGSGWVTRPLDPGLPVGESVLIRGQVKDAPVAAEGYWKCELSLQLLYATDTLYPCKTQLQVYFYPDYDSQLPGAGETWQWWGKLSPIRNSGNPGSTDFESIMHRKDVWYRFYPSGSMQQKHLNRRVSTSARKHGRAYFRRVLSDKWQGEEEELALLKAVCLGDRASLSQDMRQMYGAAGGIHLLAVSGLHVGLIWWVLQGASQCLVRKGKGEGYRALAVLALLWLYASLTGFSSSVCRSVTMFSFFSIGRILGQRTYVLNTIFASALFLVAIQPSRIMEPGFQLSYAAILGIVSFYPSIRSLFHLNSRILRWLWEASALSLAAQLLTAPLVMYYFHQLPLYSLFTSILAIPLLSLLIAIFTCSLPFMILGILEKMFSFALTNLAGLMNRTMEVVSSMPGALLEELPLSLAMMIQILLTLCLLMLVLHSRSRLQAYLMLLMFSVMMIWSAWTLSSRRRSSELVLCNFRGASMVILREGERVDHYCWYSDSVSLAYMQQYRAEAWSRRTYQNQLHLPGDSASISGSVSVCREVCRGVWILGNDRIRAWVLRGQVRGFYPCAGSINAQWDQWSAPDFILLSGEPSSVTLDALPGQMTPDLVMDGSNRKTYREKMSELQVKIYDTEAQGAFVKRW